MNLWICTAIVGVGAAAAATGARNGIEKQGAAKVTEASIASIPLEMPVDSRLRCPTAKQSDVETTHEFRATPSGEKGSEVFLVVRTSCPKYSCQGENERTVISVSIASRPEEKEQCTLPSGISLKTSRGLRLGASSAEVERLYGKPSERHPRKGKPETISYSGRLGKLPIEFNLDFVRGRVVSMMVSINEDEH